MQLKKGNYTLTLYNGKKYNIDIKSELIIKENYTSFLNSANRYLNVDDVILIFNTPKCKLEMEGEEVIYCKVKCKIGNYAIDKDNTINITLYFN